MNRSFLFIFAGATLALGFGGYLMSQSMDPFDLHSGTETEVADLSAPEGADVGWMAAVFDTVSDADEPRSGEKTAVVDPVGEAGNAVAEKGNEEGQDEALAIAEESGAKPKTLLSTLLGTGEDAAKPPSLLTKSKDASESAFKKIGSFTSACQTGGGAKICRVGE